MNREIIFKAKREYSGEWVEGYYVYCRKRHYILPVLNTTIGYDEREDEWIETDSDTLCQYTGLTDKNGTRIWENDIVLLREEIQDYEWKATVKFGNPNWEYNWGWQLIPIGECDMNKDILLWIDMDLATCQVIGNIFDNPELLEVE